MSSAPMQSAGRSTLVIAELLTGLLLLLIGIWLIVLFLLAFNGGALLAIFAVVEIILGLASLFAFYGLRSGRRAGWELWLAIAGAAFNAIVIAVAAVATLTVLYPGGPVVLLILCNDVIVGELAVLYFLTKPAS